MTDGLSGSFAASIPLAVAIFRSWSSMKNGVMAWLIYLNVLYLTGFFFLDRRERIKAGSSGLGLCRWAWVSRVTSPTWWGKCRGLPGLSRTSTAARVDSGCF